MVARPTGSPLEPSTKRDPSLRGRYRGTRERSQGPHVSTADEDLVAFANARLGTVLRGKYRLDEVVGYGGMAVVFRATHRNQAELAVKVLHPKLARVNGVRQRFLREGYAANSVKHKGAVLVLDDDVDDDGSTFLVMELLHGQSCELIWQRRGGTFPLKSALTVAHEALDVLSSAHARGIVHRDIKPANLFVTKAGALKVLDFGIAKVLDAVSAQSTGRLPIGTPAFMSPEQALGESDQVGPKTDIWAMGATLFSLLSGELVHDAPTAHEILVKTATQKPRSLATVAPFLAKEVIELVDKALAVDPAARWQTAEEMRDVAARVHKQFFLEPASTASLLELYGGDDVDTANANEATVVQVVPPKMSTPPPPDRDKPSSGRMRVSPWTDEKRTSPRLSLVLEDSSVSSPSPASPRSPSPSRRPVVPPPTSSRPENGMAPSSRGQSAPAQGAPPSDPVVGASFKGRTAKLPVPSHPSMPGLSGRPSSQPGIPSSPQLIPTSPRAPSSARNVPTGPRAWPPPPELAPLGSATARRRAKPPVMAFVAAALLVAGAAGAGWWFATHPSGRADTPPTHTP